MSILNVFVGLSTGTIILIAAVVGGVAAGSVLIAIVYIVAVRKRPAAEAFISPSSVTVEVGCQPRPSSVGRPRVPRTDLVTRGRRPRLWDWAPCGTSPAAYQSWNGRQRYGPDPDFRLVPPGQSGCWDWKPCGSLTSSFSASQNWYRPAYHNNALSPHHQHFYYSARVRDPRAYRYPAIPSLLLAWTPRIMR